MGENWPFLIVQKLSRNAQKWIKNVKVTVSGPRADSLAIVKNFVANFEQKFHYISAKLTKF